MKQPYTIEPARTAGGGKHPSLFKVASGQHLILPEWMFTREQAEAVCAALNEAYRRGVESLTNPEPPACDICGSIMIRNGDVWQCVNCGNKQGVRE